MGKKNRWFSRKGRQNERGRGPAMARRTLNFECLENRRLLSSITVTSGVVDYNSPDDIEPLSDLAVGVGGTNWQNAAMPTREPTKRWRNVRSCTRLGRCGV